MQCRPNDVARGRARAKLEHEWPAASEPRRASLSSTPTLARRRPPPAAADVTGGAEPNSSKGHTEFIFPPAILARTRNRNENTFAFIDPLSAGVDVVRGTRVYGRAAPTLRAPPAAPGPPTKGRKSLERRATVIRSAAHAPPGDHVTKHLRSSPTASASAVWPMPTRTARLRCNVRETDVALM
ncbi:hypothetical protein EVAR_83919_1 [Eumeta japonica]|uniref:Uncharacterized protein n=1 Tax=Eumeta variegata TaxID=151549 RepID=A0A4C1USL0_EUMVA|nr:hypothetical protein EVAR_83919_1 [Eumeta japonica]